MQNLQILPLYPSLDDHIKMMNLPKGEKVHTMVQIEVDKIMDVSNAEYKRRLSKKLCGSFLGMDIIDNTLMAIHSTIAIVDVLAVKKFHILPKSEKHHVLMT